LLLIRGRGRALLFLGPLRDRFLDRDRPFPPLEHERFLERERDLLLPPRERERLDRERERLFPHLEQKRFFERECDLLLPPRERLDRERERLFPPLEQERERFLEREREILLPPREHERFAERERDRLDRERERFFPPLEQERFLERDLDRLLPDRERFFEPDGDLDLEQLLAFDERRFRPLLLLALLLDRLFGKIASSSSASACAFLLRGIFSFVRKKNPKSRRSPSLGHSLTISELRKQY